MLRAEQTLQQLKKNGCLWCLLGVSVGEDSHVASGKPQFSDDVSVADDHDQAWCQQEDNSLIDGENQTDSSICFHAIVDGYGLLTVRECQRIRSLCAK